MIRRGKFSLGVLVVVATPVVCKAQGPLPTTIATAVAPDILKVKAAFASRVGGIWVGEGTIPGVGAYRSERQFVRLSENQIAVVHRMTASTTLISFDSLSFTFRRDSVLLEGADDRGQRVRAHLVKTEDPASFVFQEGENWRSEYSEFQPDSFVFRAFNKVGGSWTPYLRTAHKRGARSISQPIAEAWSSKRCSRRS
jgi:hypothetical protein